MHHSSEIKILLKLQLTERSFHCTVPTSKSRSIIDLKKGDLAETQLWQRFQSCPCLDIRDAFKAYNRLCIPEGKSFCAQSLIYIIINQSWKDYASWTCTSGSAFTAWTSSCAVTKDTVRGMTYNFLTFKGLGELYWQKQNLLIINI